MISNILRCTLGQFEDMSINDIQKDISEVRNRLTDYIYSSEDISEDLKYQIHKIQLLIHDKRVDHLTIKQIKEYIMQLISIIDFTLYFDEMTK